MSEARDRSNISKSQNQLLTNLLDAKQGSSTQNQKPSGVTFKLAKDRFRSNRLTHQPEMSIEQGDYDSVGLLQKHSNIPRQIKSRQDVRALKLAEQDRQNHPLIYRAAMRKQASLENTIRERYLSNVVYGLSKGDQNVNLVSDASLSTGDQKFQIPALAHQSLRVSSKLQGSTKADEALSQTLDKAFMKEQDLQSAARPVNTPLGTKTSRDRKTVWKNQNFSLQFINDNIDQRGRTQQGREVKAPRIPLKQRQVNTTNSNFNNTMQSFASSKKSPKFEDEKVSVPRMLMDARDSYQSVGPSRMRSDKLNPFRVRHGSTGKQGNYLMQKSPQEDKNTIFQPRPPKSHFNQNQHKYMGLDSQNQVHASQQLTSNISSSRPSKIDFELAHEKSRLSEQRQKLRDIQKVASTKQPLHSQASPMSMQQSPFGGQSKPSKSGKASFIPTVEDVDKTPGTKKANKPQKDLQPGSPRIMQDIKHRGNTLVKFFKYKEIKQKYKKGRRTESLPAGSKLETDLDDQTRMRYRIDQDVIKTLKDTEKNIMSYGLFMPQQQQQPNRSQPQVRYSLLKKGLITNKRDFTNYLSIPAPYMENERTKINKNSNKKNSKAGSMFKQPCDFTAELNQMSHQTAFMKAAKDRMNLKESKALEHMRMKDKIMNEGTKLITQEDLQEEIQNQSLKTHQAMQREMLANEKKNDQTLQFEAILTGHETISKQSVGQPSLDVEESYAKYGKGRKHPTPKNELLGSGRNANILVEDTSSFTDSKGSLDSHLSNMTRSVLSKQDIKEMRAQVDKGSIMQMSRVESFGMGNIHKVTRRY